MDDLTFDEAARKHWADRGRQDALRCRNAFMWPTSRGGVFFDIEPPADWTAEYARQAAEAYYDAWSSEESSDGH